MTWNTAPSTTIEDQVYLPESTEPDQAYTDLDVTTPITKMYNEPDNYHGLMLRLITEYPYACLLFASGAYDSTELRPKLEIIYSTCELPAASFTFIINNKTVNFSGICATAGTWSWDFGDGYQSSVQNPVHEYQETGYYTVCLETRNDCGSDTVCQLIFVNYSGISEPDGTIFSIFPNPAQDVVFIKIPKERRAKISLLDLSGKEVLLQIMNVAENETISLPLSQIEPGLYILRVVSGNNPSVGKLVIAR